MVYLSKGGMTVQRYIFEHHELIGSTNDRAKELAVGGCKEGTVVLAEGQTAGRGRLGRSFLSNKDSGIYMSIVFRTDLPACDAVKITAFAAVCVAEAIDELYGTDCRIKWVNDIIIEDRKVCGILVESGFSSGNAVPDFTVVGIGINIKKTDFGELSRIAGSIEDLTGKKASKSELISLILSKLSLLLDKSIPQETMTKYRFRSCTLGKDVYVLGKPELCGRAVAIDESGGLVIDNGFEQFTVSSGEVSIRNVQ